MKPESLLATLVLLLAACGKEPYSGPVTGKVLLRYRPPAGARYRYAFSQVSTLKAPPPNSPMGSMGDQPMTLAMWFTQQAGQTVGNGGAVGVTLVIDSAQVNSPLVEREVSGELTGAKTTLVVDDHLRVVRTDPASPLSPGASQVSEQLLGSLRTASFTLPDSAVGVGDTWTTPMQVPYTEFAGGGPVFATTRLAVTSLEVVRGDTIAGVSIQVQLPSKPIAVVVFGQRSTISLSGTVNGNQRFSLSRGAILATEYSGTVHSTLAGGVFGPKGMPVDLAQQASLTLLGGAKNGGP
jgi:hypothetical protein